MKDFLKEFKSAGLVSKTLHERLVLTTGGEAPAPINPAMPQTDKNISGHSTAENPLGDKTPAPAAAAPAAPAATDKTQEQYLMQACTSALATAEACMESVCEGKCFEAIAVDQTRMQEMQDMYGKLKEFKAKMEAWQAGTPAPAAQTAAPQPAAAVQAPAETVQTPAAPQPIAAAPMTSAA